MTWDLLKATGKLFVDLARIEVGDPLKQLAEELTQPYTDRQIAQRLKPDLSTILPDDQKWSKMRRGLTEKKVGEFLGCPDRIADWKLAAKDAEGCDYPKGVSWDEIWFYCHDSESRYYRDFQGQVGFKNQRVTYFRHYYVMKDKSWYAYESPAGAWIKRMQEDSRRG